MTMLQITLANIKRKKLRTGLIILSILLSTSLIYAVLSLSKTTTGVVEQKMKKEIGTAQLYLTVSKESNQYFLDSIKNRDVEGTEYFLESLSGFGFSTLNKENILINFSGMSPEDYGIQYPLAYIHKLDKTFEKNDVIIGQQAAKTYNFSIGDTIDVVLNGETRSYIIWGIAKDNENHLGLDAGTLDVLISLETMQEQLGIGDKVDTVRIKSNEGTDMVLLEESLSQAYPDWEVINLEEEYNFAGSMNTIIIPLMIMVVAVVMVSVYIIFSTFKIISIERMPLMGTMRSVGATKKQTISSMMVESALYGIVGGIIGDLLGIGILSVTMKLIFENFNMSIEKMNVINPIYLIIAFTIGMVLALASSYVPIFMTANKSIRGIIFGEIQNEKHISISNTIIGALMLSIGFVIYNIAPLKIELALDLLATLLTAIGAALLVPILAVLLNHILTNIFKPIFKGNMELIANNIKNDKTIMNNMVLLAVGLGVILMINNFSSSVGITVLDIYSNAKFDANIYGMNMDDEFVKKVENLEGVEHIYTTKDLNAVEANRGEIKLGTISGISGAEYSDYTFDEFGQFLTEDLMKQFKSERSIIISKFTAKKYELKVGDTLDVAFKEQVVPYKIIEIVPSIMNNGTMNYIYLDFFNQDAAKMPITSLYLNTIDGEDIEGIVQQVKEVMPYSIVPIQSLNTMRDNNMKVNEGMFALMKSVSLIAMFIGVIGIFNNFVVSFMSRRRFIATMRSLGLSKKKTIHLFMTEAFICGLIGALAGIIYGMTSLEGMKFVLDALGLPSDVLFYNFKDFAFVFISGLVIAMIAAIIPAITIAKENIVSQIKYE